MYTQSTEEDPLSLLGRLQPLFAPLRERWTTKGASLPKADGPDTVSVIPPEESQIRIANGL